MVFCVPIKKLTITLRPTLRAIRLFHELWRICSATLMPFGAAGSGPRPGAICCAPITASGAVGGVCPLCPSAGGCGPAVCTLLLSIMV